MVFKAEEEPEVLAFFVQEFEKYQELEAMYVMAQR